MALPHDLTHQEQKDTLTNEQKLIAQNLRASHKILFALSQSKEETELILDRIPELFLIIDCHGNVLKANWFTGRFFGIAEEDWLNKNITDFFSKETQKIFWSQLNKRKRDDSQGSGVHFEIPLTVHSETFDYHLSVNEVESLKVNKKPTYSIIGSDITEIRRLEKQLSQIFAAVPLGIFILDPEGYIVGPYSAYTNHIFGSHNIEKENIFNLLFDHNQENLSQSQKDGFAELKLCLNEDEIWFQFAQNRFPNEIRIERDGAVLFLDVQFHAICKDGVVVNLLVVVTDITSVINAREQQESDHTRLQRKVTHYLAIEKTPDATIRSILEDYPNYHQKLLEGINIQNVTQVKFVLHSLKSLFRAANISDIAEKIHHYEQDLNDAGEKIDSQILSEIKIYLEKEWNEISGILSLKVGSTLPVGNSSLHLRNQKNQAIQILESASLAAETKMQLIDSIRQIGYYPFKELEDILIHYGENTAESLNLAVLFDFQWDRDYFDPYLLSFLKESFMHLITNMIDHGFSNQSSEKKNIITFQTETGDIYTKFIITDNGSGFNMDLIYQRSFEKKLTDKPKAELSKQEILGFLLKPNFSTKSKASLYSGRGVGLSTVDKLIHDYGGDGLQLFNHKNGAGFEFKVLNHQKNGGRT